MRLLLPNTLGCIQGFNSNVVIMFRTNDIVLGTALAELYVKYDTT